MSEKEPTPPEKPPLTGLSLTVWNMALIALPSVPVSLLDRARALKAERN